MNELGATTTTTLQATKKPPPKPDKSIRVHSCNSRPIFFKPLKYATQMQQLKLYDPARRPPEWSALVHDGQFAVFHSDVRTDVEKNQDGRYLASGEDSTCLVFDSLAEAETYCESKVETISNLRCDIYDHTGKFKPPLLTYVNKSQVKTPRKFVVLGYAFIAAAIVCFLVEWNWNGTLVVPLIVGLNLLFASWRLIHWGTGGSDKRRSTRNG